MGELKSALRAVGDTRANGILLIANPNPKLTLDERHCGVSALNANNDGKSPNKGPPLAASNHSSLPWMDAPSRRKERLSQKQ